MNYTDFDRYHKNGCARFIDFWKEISNNKNSIKILDNKINIIYTLGYGNSEDKEYMYLVDKGITLYFPLLTISEDKVIFDDEIVDSNLNDLFKLLNNKKNFSTIINEKS